MPTACASTSSLASTPAKPARSRPRRRRSAASATASTFRGACSSAHRQFLECVALARQHGFGRLEVANLYDGRDGRQCTWPRSAPRVAVGHRGHRSGAAGVAAARRDDGALPRRLGWTAWSATGATRPRTHGRARAAPGAGPGREALRGPAARARRRDRAAPRRSAAGAASWPDDGLAVCREHGMGHIGPWLHGVRALAETDPSARRQLAGRRRKAARARLRQPQPHPAARAGDRRVSSRWATGTAVDRSCERIRSYTAAEPLPLCEFTIARGMALARFGRGERGAELRAALTELREVATRARTELGAAGDRGGARGRGGRP